MKAALSEPTLLEHCFNFHAATCVYLVRIAVHGQCDPQDESVISFPLSDTAPVVLSAIPEMVGENVVDFMLFTRRIRESLYEVSKLH